MQRGLAGAERVTNFNAAMPSWLLPCFQRGSGSSIYNRHQGAGPLEERWLYDTFFVVAAVAQFVWAALALRSPTRSLLIWGAVGNAAFVLLWLINETDRAAGWTGTVDAGECRG